MLKPPLFRNALSLLVVWVVCLPQARLEAQSARPGSSARTSTSSTGRTSGARSGGATSTTGSRSNGSGGRQYRSNTELGDATITVDAETRSLVIVTDEETHRELEKVIASLDQIKPQVLIKVVFVEVTYNKGYDVGVEANYTFNVKNPADAVLGAGSKVGSAQSLFGLASATDGTFVRVATDDWSATLHAMATRGKLEVLSRPSIMARNNQEAVIVVGQEVPFVTNSRVTSDGQTINTITYDNVGIILRVTPFITSEGMVEMIVAPEISTLTDKTVPISNNANAPVIAKRSAETVVVTPNSKTVVIGGLMETQTIQSERKVPLLGDIPLLGAAFRRKVKDDVKRELLIFLTPTIVNTRQGIDQVSRAALRKAPLVKKAYTAEELEKYLDTPSLFVDAPLPEAKEVKTVKVTKAPAKAPKGR